MELFFCYNQLDFKTVANQMLKAAQQYPCHEPQVYSRNEKEVIDRSSMADFELGRWMAKVGLAMAVQYEPTSILSLSISLETFARKCYRLGMCLITGPMLFAPVPESKANWIAEVFFGDRAERVANPSGIKHAKHYICYLDTPRIETS